MRRYIYIIIGIVILAIVVLLFALAWKKPATTNTSGGAGSLPQAGTQAGRSSGGLTTSGTQGGTSGGQVTGKGIGIVSNEPVLNYFVDSQNTVITVQPDGKIEQIAKGQSTYLSSSKINDVLWADFSYDGKKILVAFGDALNPQWSTFDVATKAWTVLPLNPAVAAWSPVDYKIAYLLASGGSGVSLQTLDITNMKAKPKILLSFPDADFEISWPATNTIFLSDRSSAFFSSSVFAFNVKSGTLAAVVKNRVGLQTRWNANGTMGLVLTGTEVVRGGKLGVIDGSGTVLHELSFLTLPSKCVFIGPAAATAATSTKTVPAAPPTLICGVPRNASVLARNPLPDAYAERRIMTADDVYRVGLTDGGITPAFNDPSQAFDTSNVKAANGSLFFVNRYDGKLYALQLGS